jgi:hypothetical protein
MPRLTLHPTTEQLAQLTALNRAINARAREMDPTRSANPIEATAAVALEYGLQALQRVWYRTEFVDHAAHPVEAPARAQHPEVQVYP